MNKIFKKLNKITYKRILNLSFGEKSYAWPVCNIRVYLYLTYDISQSVVAAVIKRPDLHAQVEFERVRIPEK